MIEIDQAAVDTVRAARQPSDLDPKAFRPRCCSSTTPPLYLTALYSLVPGANQDAASALTDIMREEMMHFAIVANVLNALGGHPLIDHKDAVPVYPRETCR